MKKVLILLALTTIMGCASKPEDIQALYYPDSAYTSMNCDALTLERNRIQSDVLQATGQQRKNRKNDQAIGWASALFFAPALFLMDGNSENATRLASLKGQYESISRVASVKQCG